MSPAKFVQSFVLKKNLIIGDVMTATTIYVVDALKKIK
jgi:hypothetical protein